MAKRKSTANKENEVPETPKTRAPRAAWNQDCDDILLEKLEQEKADGRLTSNGNFHDDAFKAAEKALAGTELHSGGAKKVAESCKTRYNMLKRFFVQVKTLRDSSGFGWDDNKKLVTATDQVWQDFLANRPIAFAKWKDTPFPSYMAMNNLINGTFATGANAFHPGHEDDGGDESEDFPLDPRLVEDEERYQSQSSDPVSQDDGFKPSQASTSSNRKRQAEESLDSSSAKRSRKTITAATGIMDMASSVRELASAFSTSAGGPSSPARRSSAIELIEEDDELSDNEQLEIFRVIRKDVSVADTILAIRNKGKRTRYIQRELEDHI